MAMNIIASLPDGSKVIQHGGRNIGWNATIMANPQWGVGVVVLTNSDNGTNLIGDVVWGKVLPQLIIERVLRILIFVLTLVILVDATFIGVRWVKARSLASQAK
jgi:hypothetical protein